MARMGREDAGTVLLKAREGQGVRAGLGWLCTGMVMRGAVLHVGGLEGHASWESVRWGRRAA